MSVKERLLVIKMAEKEKKNPKFFEEIKVDVKIIKNQCGETKVKVN